MTMPIVKTEQAIALPAKEATVLSAVATEGQLRSDEADAPCSATSPRAYVPPLVMLALILAVWQILCIEAGRDAAVADQDLGRSATT